MCDKCGKNESGRVYLVDMPLYLINLFEKSADEEVVKNGYELRRKPGGED